MSSDTITITQTIQDSYSDITPEAIFKSETLTLIDTTTTTTQQLLDTPHTYPFTDQQRTYYLIERYVDPLFGAPITKTNIIETREKSGLTFIIDTNTTNTGNINERNIQQELALTETPVKRTDLSFSPVFKSICNFIRAGDDILSIETLYQNPDTDPETLIQNGENIPVETVRITFQPNFDTNTQRVTYSNGEFDITCENNDETVFEYVTNKQTQREYVTQIIESLFHNSKQQHSTE